MLIFSSNTTWIHWKTSLNKLSLIYERKRGKKPDTKFILREAESKHGLSYTSAKSVLDEMIKDKKITVNEEESHFINSRSDSINEPVNRTIPLEPEDSKLEDASSPGIIIVGASKDRDTWVPHPNPPSPTVNTDNCMVLGTLEALARGLDSTNQLLHQERAFSKAILQENLELKLKIKELEVKNSHLLDDVILRGSSRIQRAEESDTDIDPLDEIFLPRSKKQPNSLRFTKE